MSEGEKGDGGRAFRCESAAAVPFLPQRSGYSFCVTAVP